MKKIILFLVFMGVWGCNVDKQKAIMAVESELMEHDRDVTQFNLDAHKKGKYFIVTDDGTDAFRVKDEKVICCENGNCKVLINKPFCKPLK